jgi:hypothetical protein
MGKQRHDIGTSVLLNQAPSIFDIAADWYVGQAAQFI